MEISIYAIPGINTPPEQIICECFGINRSMLFAKTRKREVVEARHFYFYMKIRENGYSGYSKLGMETGFDHSTLIYAVKNVYNLLMTDKTFQGKAKKALMQLKQAKQYKHDSDAI